MVTTLTAEDLAAMKVATDVVFRFREGKTTIEAIRRAAVDSVFNGEQRRDILCESNFHCYGSNSQKVVSAFAMNGCCQLCEVWQTILGLLKAGDTLTLRWLGDSMTTKTMTEAGLHGDELQLIITRAGARKVTRLVFTICASVCLNNFARMIQIAS